MVQRKEEIGGYQLDITIICDTPEEAANFKRTIEKLDNCLNCKITSIKPNTRYTYTKVLEILHPRNSDDENNSIAKEENLNE